MLLKESESPWGPTHNYNNQKNKFTCVLLMLLMFWPYFMVHNQQQNVIFSNEDDVSLNDRTTV